MECDVSDIGLGCIVNVELVVRSTCEFQLIFICYFYVTVRWREPRVSIKESWRLVHKYTPSLIWWVILGLIPCCCGLQHKYQWNNLEISAFNTSVWCPFWQVSTLISSYANWRWLITRPKTCRSMKQCKKYTLIKPMSCVWLHIACIYNSIQHNGGVTPESHGQEISHLYVPKYLL
jgi:hypothetical protein